MKDKQNDTKIYKTLSNCNSPLINTVFDLGLSYNNIKSPKIGLHLPFEWSSPSQYSNILNSDSKYFKYIKLSNISPEISTHTNETPFFGSILKKNLMQYELNKDL